MLWTALKSLFLLAGDEKACSQSKVGEVLEAAEGASISIINRAMSFAIKISAYQSARRLARQSEQAK